MCLWFPVSKYYKYDETKENIQSLREKYSQLHNQIEHRMDVLDPGMIPNFGAMLMLKLSLVNGV